MPNLNKVQLMGNLTRDPELRYLPKGTAVCNLSIAVNRTWKDETGAKKEEATFVGVTAWGKQAETIAQYLKKGRPIFVEGRISNESWDDKTSGEKKSRTGVTLESFQFLDSGESRTNSSDRTALAPALDRAASAFPSRAAAPVAAGETDDSVPF